MITPGNLVRHELIGLAVKISESKNPQLSGISGRVIDETRNTLVIEKGDGSEKRIAKEDCTFSFRMPGSGEWVSVEGSVILARPEDRIKKKLDKW